MIGRLFKRRAADVYRVTRYASPRAYLAERANGAGLIRTFPLPGDNLPAVPVQLPGTANCAGSADLAAGASSSKGGE